MKTRKKQSGFIVSTELILIAIILVIGLIVGLHAVRTAVVTELADVAGAIGSLSQTYSFSGATGHHSSTNGSLWQDNTDTCDDVGPGQAGVNSQCVQVCVVGVTDASPEESPSLAPSP